MHASTQQVALFCTSMHYAWSLYLEILNMLSIQITQAEGSDV